MVDKTPKNTDSIEQLHQIVADGGFDIQEPEDKNLEYAGGEYDISKLIDEGINKEFAEELLRLVVDYLKKPIITDSYGEDHGKRRVAEDDLREGHDPETSGRINQIFQSNKLGINSLGSIYSFIQFLWNECKIPENSPLRTIFMKLPLMKIQLENSTEFEPSYNGVGESDGVNENLLEWKIEILKIIDSVCFEFLDFLKSENNR